MTPPSQLEQIGKRIAQAREALQLSQADVCRALGVGKTTWNHWELGRRKPDPIALIRFANNYGVTLDWIYRGDNAEYRSAGKGLCLHFVAPPAEGVIFGHITRTAQSTQCRRFLLTRSTERR